MKGDNKIPCRKCLLSDYAGEEYLEHMRVYLSGLDEALKADDKLYEERLKACRDCQNLMEGLCKVCGCFVEYRAAMKHKCCPDIHPKW